MVDSSLSTSLKEIEGTPRLRLKIRWSRFTFMAGAVFLHLLRSGRGFALDPAKDVLQYNCQTWSRQNGLPVNGINAIGGSLTMFSDGPGKGATFTLELPLGPDHTRPMNEGTR